MAAPAHSIQNRRLKFVPIGRSSAAQPLHDLLGLLLHDHGLNQKKFGRDLDSIIHDFPPRRERLLKKRDYYQRKKSNYYRRKYASHRRMNIAMNDPVADVAYLEKIKYIKKEGRRFKLNVKNVDWEIKKGASTQLVVPLTDRRMAINAANGRWVSYRDALAKSNIFEKEKAKGEKALMKAISKNILDGNDKYLTLKSGSWHDAVSFAVKNGQLKIALADGRTTSLANPRKFRGFNGDPKKPSNLLFRHHGLHMELVVGGKDLLAKTNKARISDCIREGSQTVIEDLEDAMAATNVYDKVFGYLTWLGLNKGDISETFEKTGRMMTRRLVPDREYFSPNGKKFKLPGRSVMLIRNTGLRIGKELKMMKDRQGNPVPEHIIDAVVTALIGLYDLKKGKNHPFRNSKTGSIYIVMPKLHGPEEVAYVADLFTRIEKMVGLKKNTMKIGIMDEELRTSANLMECIRAAKGRAIFINTGFLDRTGELIHSCMEAGPLLPKAKIKQAMWFKAYEELNTLTGLVCGLEGGLGKGMWAETDNAKGLLESKEDHVVNGAASMSWTASPEHSAIGNTAYLDTNVFSIQRKLRGDLTKMSKKQRRELLHKMFMLPLADRNKDLTPDVVEAELMNCAQGMLGYLSRWIQEGIGCSKVPDIRGKNLMEDCATARISKEIIQNWLKHKVCTEAQVLRILKKMAVEVDKQNKYLPDGTPNKNYEPMAGNFENSFCFNAVKDLIFKDKIERYMQPRIFEARERERKYRLNVNKAISRFQETQDANVAWLADERRKRGLPAARPNNWTFPKQVQQAQKAKAA